MSDLAAQSVIIGDATRGERVLDTPNALSGGTYDTGGIVKIKNPALVKVPALDVGLFTRCHHVKNFKAPQQVPD